MKRTALLVLALLATPLLVLALPASFEPTPPAGQWVPTGSGDCPEGMRCAEWCTFVAGREVASGILCCLPEESAFSTDFGACESLRQ